jgi:hypothetical protein
MNASEQIDREIALLGDWRGQTLAEIRSVIHEADPEVVEEWKWMGTAAWSDDGLICVANAHAHIVKVTFSRGAQLLDPEKLFNAGLEGNMWRAINFSEGDKIRKTALKKLIRAAVAFNHLTKMKTAPLAAPRKRGPKTSGSTKD